MRVSVNPATMRPNIHRATGVALGALERAMRTTVEDDVIDKATERLLADAERIRKAEAAERDAARRIAEMDPERFDEFTGPIGGSQ